MIKKRRQRCERHKATGRSWDEYVFGFMDYKGTEIWRCKECKEADEKWLAEYEQQKAEEKIRLAEDMRQFWVRKREREEAQKKKEKEELWDCYVKKSMLAGVKYSGQMKISKELLQLKRATIKLNRLIDKAKEAEKEAIEKQKEEYEKEEHRTARLNGILVNCKKHGALKLKEVIKAGKSRWTGKQCYKCRKCMKKTHRNYYERKKDYVLNKHAEYRRNNPKKVKETKAKSWRNHHGKDKEHESIA